MSHCHPSRVKMNYYDPALSFDELNATEQREIRDYADELTHKSFTKYLKLLPLAFASALLLMSYSPAPTIQPLEAAYGDPPKPLPAVTVQSLTELFVTQFWSGNRTVCSMKKEIMDWGAWSYNGAGIKIY